MTYSNTTTTTATIGWTRTDAGMLICLKGLDRELIEFLTGQDQESDKEACIAPPERWSEKFRSGEPVTNLQENESNVFRLVSYTETSLKVSHTRDISTLYEFDDETDAYGHLNYTVYSTDEENFPEDMLAFDWQWVDERLFLTCTVNCETGGFIANLDKTVVVELYELNTQSFVDSCFDWFYNNEIPVDSREAETLASSMLEDILPARPILGGADE